MNFIIGGVNASILTFNFMVGIILFHDNFPFSFCGGSYLGNGTIITAAHCVKNLQKKNTSARVYYNLQDLNNFLDHDQYHKVIRYKIHDLFEENNLTHDVALLKIPDININNVMIPNSTYDTNDTFLILGYGFIDKKITHLNGLHLGKVKILDRTMYPNLNTDDSMLIAQGIANDTTIDSCFGDSGSPLLLIDKNNNNIIYGITSWGIGCANILYPGVYSNVFYLKDWIIKIEELFKN
jgi:secreted trypsin-like serine protease